MRKSTRSVLLLSLSIILIFLLTISLNVPDFHNGIPMPDGPYSSTGNGTSTLENLYNLVIQSFGQLGDQAESFRHKLTLFAAPLSITVLILMAVLFLFSGKLRRLIVMRMIASLIVMAILMAIFYSDIPESRQDTGEMIVTDMGEMIGEELINETNTSEEEPVPEIPRGLSYTFSFVLVLLFLLILFFLFKRIRAIQSHQKKRSILDVTEETLQSIREGSDFSNAILRCYDEMSMILKESKGLVRSSAMTAGEFRDSLTMEGLPAGEIKSLTGLFEKVRYGKGQLSADDEKAAETCLKGIISSLEPR